MFGLHQDTINEIHSVFRRNEKIDEVLIFGSRAKGNFTSGSDIDLALIGEYLNKEDLLDVQLAIEDIGLLYGVDVVLFNDDLDKPLKEHIERVGKTFYKR